METGNEVAEADNDNRKVGFVTIHVDFAKSILGITKVVASILSIIGFICVISGNYLLCYTYGPQRFFEFTTMTSFWATVFLYFIYLTGLNNVIRFIDWELTRLVWSCVDGGFFLISSAILAANTCYSGSIKAAAVFGFFACIAFGVLAFFSFQEFRKKTVIATSSSSRPTAAPEYTPDEKY